MGKTTTAVGSKVDLPATGEAHVWRVSLLEVDATAGDQVERPGARVVRRCVGRENVQRAEAIRRSLRVTLAAYLESQPSQLLFVRRPGGKPELAYPWEQSGLQFNLSHSGQWLLLAVSSRRNIGIDVERRVPLVDYEAVGRTCFADEELDLLRGVDPSRQCDLFYRLWTRKEAWGKAAGIGLVAGGPAATPAFPDGWTGVEMDSLPGYASALVLEGEIRAVREFEMIGCRPAKGPGVASRDAVEAAETQGPRAAE